MDIPALPSETELKIMFALLEQPAGVYARQIVDLADIPPKSEHNHFRRLQGKGFVVASDDPQPYYKLTRQGKILAEALKAAFEEMRRK